MNNVITTVNKLNILAFPTYPNKKKKNDIGVLVLLVELIY